MASLIVTPRRFRAVTSMPSGKCRSILLTGGLVRCSLRMSLSSIVLEEVLIFLCVVRGNESAQVAPRHATAAGGDQGRELTILSFVSPARAQARCLVPLQK